MRCIVEVYRRVSAAPSRHVVVDTHRVLLPDALQRGRVLGPLQLDESSRRQGQPRLAHRGGDHCRFAPLSARPRSRPDPNAPPGRIEYVYTVDDVACSSDVVLFGQGYTFDNFHRYPAGTTVTVTYDPDDVTNAVLEPGEFNNFAPFYFGGGVLLFCGLGRGL